MRPLPSSFSHPPSSLSHLLYPPCSLASPSTSSSLSYRNGHSGFKSAHYPTLPATASLMDKAEQGFVKPASAPYSESP